MPFASTPGRAGLADGERRAGCRARH